MRTNHMKTRDDPTPETSPVLNIHQIMRHVQTNHDQPLSQTFKSCH